MLRGGHAALAGLALLALPAFGGEAVFLSPTLELDRVYRSMQGPSATVEVRLATGAPRVLYVTGLETEVVGSGPERLCHLNLDVDLRAHRKVFGARGNGTRLFTLSQGAASAQLPPGFGLPVLSNEPLKLTTQALDLDGAKAKLRFRTRVRFEEGPLKPLILAGANVMKCGPDARAASKHGMSTDGVREGCTAHWVVPPGKEEVRSPANHQLALTHDTRIHQILVHVHPYAQWVELFDLTAKKPVFRAGVAGRATGVEAVEAYSSAEGLPLFKDHKYELAALYDNPTKSESDAMAVFYMLVEDKAFKLRN